MTNATRLRVEFGGGAELLFGNQKQHDVTLPTGPERCTLSDLIMWLKENLLKGKEELFVQGKTGGLAYELKSDDNVLFISTLHGG
uniref:Ubiquitin-related modifier 1 homolog n=1 Tax=Amblyomma maculatum TaxID=34609 RepID=G3MN91_AMBMU